MKKTPLVSLAPVKQSRKQPKKYLKYANIATPSGICFLINESDVFINKNTNNKSAQYTILRKKKVAGLLKKCVFKVIIVTNILTNAQIFNFYFVNQVKNAGINKVYKKNWLII